MTLKVGEVTLRPYQEECVRVAYDALANRGVKRGIITLPTGGGKTITASALVHFILKAMLSAANGKGNCLWVAHRTELLDQAVTAFKKVAPHLRITRWDASKKDDSGDLVIASIGSTRTLKKKFTIVIYDEGHHYAAENEDDEYSNMYAELLKRIEWDYLIGLTATVERLDGRMLGYDEIIYSITFLDLVKKHRLAKPIYTEMLTKQNHQLAVRGGEFTKKSLQKLDNPDRNRRIAIEYVKNADRYGKTLMFVTGVEHCYNMQAALGEAAKQLGVPDVEIRIIHGNSKKRPYKKSERNEAIDWFTQGLPSSKMILINCEVYTEGYDEPSIRSVFLTRPTMSKGLWMQMVGRGARNYDVSYEVSMGHIVERTPIGGDGIEIFEFSNGAKYYGEDWGPTGKVDQVDNPIHHLRLQMEKEFYLVQVMDDITKFHALVEDWQLDVRERTAEELEDLELAETLEERRVKLRILKERGDIETEEMDLDELGDAVIRDLVGVLVISAFFHKSLGIPCDMERQAVLHALHRFAQEDCTYQQQQTTQKYNQATGMNEPVIESIPVFDNEKFKSEAYTKCVSAGEFPPSVFKKIVYSYFFRFVRGIEQIRPKGESRTFPTWNYIPMVELTAESRRENIRIAEEKMKENQVRNDEFNQKVATRVQLDQLWLEIKDATYKQVVPLAKNPRAARNLINRKWANLTLMRGQDRNIVCHLNEVIDSPRAGGQMAYLAKLLTKGFQEVWDDPNCLVTITPQKVVWDRDGSSVGAK